METNNEEEMAQIAAQETQEYNDQRPRRMSEFWTSISAKKLPESPYSSPPESPQIHAAWRPDIGLRRIRRWSFQRIIIIVVLGSVSLMALIQVLTSAGEVLASLYPNEMDWLLDSIGQLDPEDRASRWPTDDMSNVEPVSCLSHNDEWQRWPLYAAVNAGCISFEADVWLFDGEIYVGHSPSELSLERTLRRVYLEPLLDLVQKANGISSNDSLSSNEAKQLHGVFSTNPAQSLVFLVDFKTANDELFVQLENQLEPMRAANILTYYNGTHLVNGPVTVVASGKASFEKITANKTYRDIFYDAPLDKVVDNDIGTLPSGIQLADGEQPLSNENDSIRSDHSKFRRGEDDVEDSFSATRERYNATNSYFASTSFRHTVGRVWGSRLTKAQLQKIRSHIDGAHQHGLKARYWQTPMWPTGLRNYVWNVLLLHEGVDILGIDDLSGATRIDWDK